MLKRLLAGVTPAHHELRAGSPSQPTKATPVHKLITDKPIIKSAGLLTPIPEVMSVLTICWHLIASLPLIVLDDKNVYGQQFMTKCYRRAHFDAGRFVEAWDDEGARKGIACTRWAVRPDHL